MHQDFFILLFHLHRYMGLIALQGEHLVAEVFTWNLPQKIILSLFIEEVVSGGGRPKVFAEVFFTGAPIRNICPGVNIKMTPRCLTVQKHHHTIIKKKAQNKAPRAIEHYDPGAYPCRQAHRGRVNKKNYQTDFHYYTSSCASKLSSKHRCSLSFQGCLVCGALQ
jgi:hypothetical protein